MKLRPFRNTGMQVSEIGLEAPAAASRFRVRETFFSDGENGRLGLYQVWEAV